MSAVLKHFKVVCRHKWEVFKQCKACGILWQGIIHDMSKFSPAEFLASAKYFQGNRSPIEAEKEDCGYSLAWLHHKGHNKHHWEYWTDFDEKDGHVITNKMPMKYVIEMVCDWIGAGKVYAKEEWTTSSPLQHYQKMRNGRHFHIDTDIVIMNYLYLIRDSGLDEFHRVAREQRKLGLNYGARKYDDSKSD